MQIEIDGLNWVPAYIGKRTGIKHVKSKISNPGIYFIKENGVLVYIGMSKYNVKDVLYRHFQCWNPDVRQQNHYRVCYKEELGKNHYEVSVVLIDKNIVHETEIYNIKHYQPRDNRKYEQTDSFKQVCREQGIIIDNELPF